MRRVKNANCYIFIVAAVFALLGQSAFAATQAEENRGLVAALQATLTRHPALSGKQAEVNAKYFAVDSAKASRYPSLQGQISYNEHDSKQGTLRASQPLWAFGKIDSRIAYADTDVAVEEADQLRVKRQLLEKTATSYAQILGVYQRQKVAIANIASHEELFNQIERRQRGQLASETDVRLAKARLIQAQLQRQRIDGELRSAQADLQSYTQIVIAADLAVPAQFLQLPAADEIVSQSLLRSAEVKFKIAQIALAQARLDQESVAALPTIQAQVVYNNNDAFQTQDDTTFSVVLEGGLDGLGLVDWGRQRTAQAQLEAARQDMQVVRNDLTRRVSILISNRHTQKSIMQIQKESVAALQATLDSYQRQYEAGRKAWLDVLNIQRELTEQRLQEVQAANDWQIYSLIMKSLTGGLDLS